MLSTKARRVKTPSPAPQRGARAAGPTDYSPLLSKPPARRTRASARPPGEPDRGERRESERGVGEVARGGLEGVVERVADEREGHRPQAGAEDAPREERPQAHRRRAGQEGRDRAHEADEAADQDGLATVAIEEALDALEPRPGDADAGAARDEEGAPEAAPEREGGEVAGRGRRPGDREHEGKVDAALARDAAAEHARGLAGPHEPHEGARPQEGERADHGVGPGAERVGEVGERARQVRRGDDPRLDRGEHRRAGEPQAEQGGAVAALGQAGGRGAPGPVGEGPGAGAPRPPWGRRAAAALMPR